MPVSQDIFKAYDIRAVYPDALTEEVAYRVGRAVSTTEMQAPAIVVGRDSRVSGPSLSEWLIDGVCDQGPDVVDIGLVSTDQFYFTCASEGLPGVMVTASHNPPQYNGFKMVASDGSVIGSGNGMDTVQKLVTDASFPTPVKTGRHTRKDIRKAFLDLLSGLVSPGSVGELSVVVDAGNGGVGPVLSELFERYPTLTVHPLFWEPDGRFPNRGPDPLKDGALDRLMREVRTRGAGLGVAFDGDGDRVFFVDEDGEMVPPDFITALLCEHLLGRSSERESVVLDLTVSRVAEDAVGRMNGQVLRERVGHTFIKRAMKNSGALFGAERSGHYYFRDFFCADSGMRTLLSVLELLTDQKRALKQCVTPLRERYFISDPLTFEVSEDPDRVIDRVKERFRDAEIGTMDGISVSYDDWRCVVRRSNTEPVVRAVVEAHSPDTLRIKIKELTDVISV